MSSFRELVQYIQSDLEDIKDDKISLKAQLRKLLRKNKIYQNQITCGNQLVTNFTDKKVVVQLVIGLTQSGKTGAMISLIKYYIYNPDNIIPPENIYIITGLSSTEWKEQTKNRFPDSLEKNIFHNGNLKSFEENIKDKKNVLIIMDEIQYAGKEKQRIYNTFKELKYYDTNNLLENDIKIVEFTATPDGHFKAIKELKENSKIVKLEPGIGYTSIFDLLDKGRMKIAENLLCLKPNGELDFPAFKIKIQPFDDIIKHYIKPKYHIIRFPNTKEDKYNNTLKLFKMKYLEGEYEYIPYDGNNEIDIEEELKKEPIKHTFIIVKEKLRCAKTITKTHLGIVYERTPKEVINSTIIQALAGRVTGYDVTDDIYCFTDIVSIQNYRILWDNNFEDDSISWKGNIIEGKTFNNGLSCSDIAVKEENEDIKYKPFDTFDEAKNYVIKVLKRTQRPHNLEKRKKDKDDYYICPINNKKDKGQKRSYEYIKKNKKNALGSKPYVLRICYKDINDKDTIKFVIIHKKLD
jgi:hypothetical protein